MLNFAHYHFLSQLLSSLRANKPYFVAKGTKTGCRLAAILIELGIITHTSHPDWETVKHYPIKYREKMIVFWLNSIYINNRYRNNPHSMAPKVRNSMKTSITKLQIFGKPGQKEIKFTYKELLNQNFLNAVYILHTSRGIITSIEAVEHKLGGIALCVIHF